MDRFIYVAMTGASESLRMQATNGHNLANASTTGFRADLALFQARQVVGGGFESRAYATGVGAGGSAAGTSLVCLPTTQCRRDGRCRDIPRPLARQ